MAEYDRTPVVEIAITADMTLTAWRDTFYGRVAKDVAHLIIGAHASR